MRGAYCGKLPGAAGGMRVSAVPGLGMDDLPAAQRGGTAGGVRSGNAVLGRVTLCGGDGCLPAPERRER